MLRPLVLAYILVLSIFRRRANAAQQPAPAPTVPLELPSTAKALAAKAKDLEALRTAVVEAAGVSAGLWFSYLFVLLYLLIAVGSITHQDLFLEKPVKLPFLGVDLPLLGFFWLGPALFLIVHAYVLLHFVLLAGKVGDFHAELREQIAQDEETRTRLRRQLPSNIFVQFLAGPEEIRTGVLGFMLKVIAWITLVIGPIALLLFFQLQFLPYHNWKITWWHRTAIVIDLILLWMLWPSIVGGRIVRLAWHGIRRVRVAIEGLASFAVILLVFTVATFPGEWLEGISSRMPAFIPWKDDEGNWGRTSLHELLVAGEVDLAARRPMSPWANRLVLPGLDVIDRTKFDTEAKIAALPESISLRTRDLEGAVLIGAKLRKADLTAAKLQGAQLRDADLRGTKFECAQENCAQLQGADLSGAELQGASLRGAELQGADLTVAQLQGASLRRAELQGADLTVAQLQGADLSGADLQGADLQGAELQGADLSEAELQGANLSGAELQGANLSRAELQGADLSRAELQGASFEEILIWRADARTVHGAAARVLRPKDEKLSTTSFEELKGLIMKQVPEGGKQRAALRRLEQLNPDKPLNGEYEMAKAWIALEQSSPNPKTFEEIVAKQLRELGCAADEGAPYVLQGLLNYRRMFSAPLEGLEGPALAAAFLKEDCVGARGLTEDQKTMLKAVRDKAPASGPEQSPQAQP